MSSSIFHSSSLDVTHRVVDMPLGGYSIMTQVEAIGTPHKQPVVLLALIDNSGSMGASAGTTPGAEDHGFSRLDLVKHAVRTMAVLLGPEDSVGLVSFSTEARIVLAPTRMDAAGRAAVNVALDTVRPDANTNIWDGLRKAAELASAPAYAGCHIATMLLTDGYPNLEPPRGTLATLRSGGLPVANPWTVHTFGFGYDLDSRLCAEIAEWGGGVFGFIPDATMVGTVFINALAYILTTATTGTVLEVPGSLVPLQTGAIGWQQPRTFLTSYIPIAMEPSEPEDPIVFTAGADSTASLEFPPIPRIRISEDSDAAFATFRYQYIELLGKVITACETTTAVHGVSNAGVLAAQEMLANFEIASESLAVMHPGIAAILRDIRSSKEGEGQVGLAPSYYRRWGRHYLRAYKRAQELQQCMNFKDPGLQIYGGDLFHSLQDAGDKAFLTLPPPKPSMITQMGMYGGTASAAASSTPICMSVFHNASAGCFAPTTLIRMADESQKKIEEISPGEFVKTPSGPAQVRALVTCGSYNRSQPMSRVGDLWITPWHPILVANQWKFPADLVGYTERLLPTVYNLVLDNGHIVFAEDIMAVTLAHGFNESVVAHPFFGTDAVLHNLAMIAGWERGRPVFHNLRTQRDPVSGIICGWYDDI